jgi:phosphate starvation-inducible protein PhoH
MMLSESVAEQWVTHEEEIGISARKESFDRVRNILLSFTARGYFAQVMQRERHHRCYKRWQEIFEIPRLYQEVRDELRDMHEYLVMSQAEQLQRLEEQEQRQAEARAKAEELKERAAQQRAARLESRLSLIAWVLGGPVAGLTFLQAAAAVSWQMAALMAFVMLVAGAFLYRLLTRSTAISNKIDSGDKPV